MSAEPKDFSHVPLWDESNPEGSFDIIPKD